MRTKAILMAGAVAAALAVCAPSPAAADDGKRQAKNALYVELLGNGFLYTVNYERLLQDDVWLRIGFETVNWTEGGLFSEGEHHELVAVPLMVSRLFGSRYGRLELGLGVVPNTLTGVSATATAGFRFQPPDGGFLFKVGFTPVYPFYAYESESDYEEDDPKFLPWFGLSLGWAW